MEVAEAKRTGPVVVQSLDDFKRNCSLLESELVSESATMGPELEKVTGWIGWIAGNNGTQAHNDHFFTVALPRFTQLLLKRSYQDPVAAPARVQVFLRHMVTVVIHHIPKDIPELNIVLLWLLNERQHFFASYGRPQSKRKLAGAGIELDEDWCEELSPGEGIDVQISDDEWVRGTIVNMSPTKTELQVAVVGKAGTEKNWFSSGDERLAPFGTKTGGAAATAAAAAAEPTPEELALEAAAKARDERWRTGLRIGSMVDMEDRAHNWYQAIVVNARLETPLAVDEDGNPIVAEDGSGAADEDKEGEGGEAEKVLFLHVSFVGWASKYDEWLPTTSTRIAPLNSRSMGAKGKLASHSLEPDAALAVDDADDPDTVFALRRPGETYSHFLIDLVQWFGQNNGFMVLLARVQALEPTPIPIGQLRVLLVAVGNIAKHLTRGFARHWVPAFFDAVKKVLVTVDAARLRQLDLDTLNEITGQLRRLLRRCYSAFETAQAIETLQLDMAAKMAMSDMLARRLDGLKLTLAMVEWTRNRERFPEGFKKTRWMDATGAEHTEHNLVDVALWTTPELLARFITHHDMITDYFLRRPHVQLMQRSLGLVSFLAENGALTTEQLDHVWAVATSDRASVEERKQVNRVLGQLFRSLPEEQRTLVIGRLRSMAPSEMSSLTIELIRDMATSGAGDAPATVAAQLLFIGSQDASPWGDVLAEEAQSALERALDDESLSGLRETFMRRCLANIAACQSRAQSVRLLRSIIMTYPRESSAEGVMSRADLIASLELEHNLIGTWFAMLLEFKKMAADTVAGMAEGMGEELSEESIEALPIGDSRDRFLDELKELLVFLSFVVGSSDVMLTPEQVDTLWDALNTRALTEGERGVCFTWFTDACKELSKATKAGADGAAASAEAPAPKRGTFFTEEVALGFFHHKMSDVRGVEPMTGPGFNCLRTYFLFANHRGGAIRLLESGADGAFEVLDLDLAGIDIVWKVVFHASAPRTALSAVAFLISLQHKLHASVAGLIGDLRRDAVARCMDAMGAGARLLKSETPGDQQRAAMLVSRGVTMISAILDAADVESVGRAPSHLPRRSTGKGFKLKLLNSARGSPTKGSNHFFNVRDTDLVGEVLAQVSDIVQLHPRVLKLYIGTQEVKSDSYQKSLVEIGLTEGTTLLASSTLPKEEKKEEKEGEGGSAAEGGAGGAGASELSGDDMFNELLSAMESGTADGHGSPVVVGRRLLRALSSSEVFVQRWEGVPGQRARFYKSMIPDLGIAMCRSCQHFFHQEDFEFAVLQKGHCPFCRADAAEVGLG
uniref:UBP34/UBP24/USP9X/USP9Y-like ARM repeat region domain-containing protein n=1 Tax=Bicosoecida sp. CB-2014 TaxID=1486930 RepID=A0A7S1G6F9_9STRA|mmetsp:Transcript_18056/g.63866  ORF Transcript_18056/g.63866 Transcript_18056/m.63866 type:complete len:1302 (+) Transcript_18056:401-4306(+)